MQQSFKDMAQRIENAEKAFREVVQQTTGCDEAAANKVLRLYVKERLAKVDVGIGAVQVKHGALLGRDVLLRAIDMAS